MSAKYSHHAGRLIAFEGIDGSGKSTALALVAQGLERRGERVFLPRLGKRHVSRLARTIRELARDRRNLELDRHSELLLYCAREAQLLAELVVPALRDGHTVLIDRSLLTPVVLGRARGLPALECERVAAFAGNGLEPDLTLVFDVHPKTSRMRKRIERLRNHSDEPSGRKGLSGSAFKQRIREQYQSTANARGYPLLHAERASPEQLAERALAIIDHGAKALVQSEHDRIPFWVVEDREPLRALQRLPAAIALYLGDGLRYARELRARELAAEPALCAATLDSEDPLRDAVAEIEPEYALRRLARQPIDHARDLRLRLLDRCPAACIMALRYEHGPAADLLRERYADTCSDAVLRSLEGREDERATLLRARASVNGSDAALGASLGLCGSDAAWRARDALFERDPTAGLRSLRGLEGPRAQRRLERNVDLAPKLVLDALLGRADPAAHDLREALFTTGHEVIQSVRGLDDARSWALRERALELWPSTVAHSLLGVAGRSQVQAMAERCAARAAGDLHVHRRLQQLAESALRADWAQFRPELGALEDEGEA